MAEHGYVYAFRYRHKNTQWMKVGMTANNDEAACWGRIKHYVREHNLPANNWEFVGFIASRRAHALEQRLHRRLRKYRIQQGAARELFACSLAMYEAVLDAEYEFIVAHEPAEERATLALPPGWDAERQRADPVERLRGVGWGLGHPRQGRPVSGLPAVNLTGFEGLADHDVDEGAETAR